MARHTRGIRISAEDLARLTRCAQARTTAQGVALRCRIVLRLAQGLSVRDVATDLAIARRTVELWRDRFEGEGLESLMHEKPGRGRKSTRR